MASWLGRQWASVTGAPAGRGAAYREGRRDERRDTPPRGTTRGEIEAAYERGRRAARPRRGSPLFGGIVLLLAAFAVLVIVLAIRDGSLAAAGAAIDQTFAAAQDRATAPVRGAADRAGSALQNAGGALRRQAGSPGQ